MYNFQEKATIPVKIWQPIFNRHVPNINKVSDELSLLKIVEMERVPKIFLQ